MTTQAHCVVQASVVAFDGQAIALEGAPGAGKSSLALALIDCGASLIGDDAVTLTRSGETIIASPPPNISGLIEVHGVGLITLPAAKAAPLCLILDLSGEVERLPDAPPRRDVLGVGIPCLPFAPGNIAPARRALYALELHGLPKPD